MKIYNKPAEDVSSDSEEPTVGRSTPQNSKQLLYYDAKQLLVHWEVQACCHLTTLRIPWMREAGTDTKEDKKGSS
jgi:hypothetical protein